jgi:N-acetylglucosaminyl-diphospho-decaprenol L-rhamnosyltransferase
VKASVVVVNYNGGEALADDLRRIRDRLPAACELLVVDNGSTDGSAARVRAALPDVRLVEAGVNRGYAAGVNRGVEAAEGDVLVVLNPDALPEEGAVERLVEAVRANPEFAVLGGTVLDRTGTRIDACCARPRPELSDILREGVFLPARHHPSYRRLRAGEAGERGVIPAPVVSGAAFAFSRAWRDRLGPMNEEYFLYQEDVEWCERAHRSGGRVGVVPGARFRHGQGGTTRRSEGRPFTARMLSDFQFFVEHRGVPARAVRWRWRVRNAFRTWLYRADAGLGVLGHRPGSPARVRIYGTLARALRSLRWRPSVQAQNAHPDRLRELAGVDVPDGDADGKDAAAGSAGHGVRP